MRQPRVDEWSVASSGDSVRVLGPGRREDQEAASFLRMTALRGLSHNTVLAYAFDLVVLRRWLAECNLTLKQLQASDLALFLGAGDIDALARRTTT